MKTVKKILLCMTCFFNIHQLYAMQIGAYDGGEYISYISKIFNNNLLISDADERVLGQQSLQNQETYWQGRTMDFDHVRAQFPIFSTQVNGYPLVYLDSASTAQMPQEVLDAMVAYYQTYKSNVGRGLYNFAERATHAFEQTRAKVADFIGAQKEEIVFTSGATASINLAAHIWVQHHVQAGDEIVLSETEHNANFIPWQQLAKQKGAVLKIVPINDRGVVDLQIFKTYLSDKTKFVAINQQSNILGTSNDIAAIVQAAHSVGVKVLVDAAQSIAHQKIDVQKLQCDFLAFSGHKLFGPTGVGVLFVKKGLCDECVLHNFGGGMVTSVTHEQTEFKCFPYCLEPGTQAIAQVIGLGAAIDFIQKNINFEQAQAYETNLVHYLAAKLQEMEQVHIISFVPQDGEHNNMVTFTVDGFHTHDVASYLDLYGIAVRSGFHCVQPYHDKLGGNASLRVSFSVYNTQKEVDWFVECLKKMLLVA